MKISMPVVLLLSLTAVMAQPLLINPEVKHEFGHDIFKTQATNIILGNYYRFENSTDLIHWKTNMSTYYHVILTNEVLQSEGYPIASNAVLHVALIEVTSNSIFHP